MPRVEAHLEEAKPRLRSDAVIRRYGNEAVVWSRESGSVIMLDAVAALVVEFFDGAVTIRELVQDVHDIVGVPEAVAFKRLSRVHAGLFAAGLLVSSVEPVSTTGLDLFPGPPSH